MMSPITELLDQTIQHGLNTISSDDLPDGLSKKAAKEHLNSYYAQWKEEHQHEFESSCKVRVHACGDGSGGCGLR